MTASSNTICVGTAVSFITSQSNGGTNPTYQWFLNGNSTGTNASAFNTSTLNNGDVITVMMTSNAACTSTTIANSNTVNITVLSLPTANFNYIVADQEVSFNDQSVNSNAWSWDSLSLRLFF